MYLLLLTTLLFAAHGVFVSCDDNEDFTTSPSAKLTFPADTLRLDTALTVVSSPTYSFTVHNRTSKGIRITNVALANPESSGFRVNVDGTFINEDYDYAISVDGGVNLATIQDVVAAGADIAVAGSAFYNESDKLSFMQRMQELAMESFK